ncbi:MAG: hypothetical protein OEY81_03230 [Candidatus Bathyarchaeota archaeon]|nr:hypothetical protein [Candidatus Bathyarchaeota archaeon]
MTRKTKHMGERYSREPPKVPLRFVGGEGAPQELHGEPLRVGDVRLLSKAYLVYRWWKPAEPEEEGGE